MGNTELPSRVHPRPACASRRWADLAGRSVALSPDIPTIFDAPLAPHHRLIGRWAASCDKSTRTYTRAQARRRIERVFDSAVLEILEPLDIADFRVAALHSEGDSPPAIAIFCESMGQLDLGWIETGDAPIPWRAAAYSALEETLGLALPIFGYQDLFYEISLYYWDGETEDEAARQNLIDYHGADPDDLDEMALPSAMDARRPDWMIAANAAPSARLPIGLRRKLHRLRETHKALKRLPPERSAWHFDFEVASEYILGIEECSSLPPLTLVPFEQFARELDDVGRNGMEMGFMDVAGLCPLPDAGHIDDWFASLKLGAQFLAAAQDLIRFDPENP
tara:strand:+ start:6004 stop:7011 length:1008 start_codon:yes stop_codon:yes gene_type:complete